MRRVQHIEAAATHGLLPPTTQTTLGKGSYLYRYVVAYVGVTYLSLSNTYVAQLAKNSLREACRHHALLRAFVIRHGSNA